jgi:acetyltransferase-like isoleucine patch superfamily enzyme
MACENNSQEIDLSGVYSVSGRPVSADWVQFGAHSYYANHLGVGSWTFREKIIVGKYCSIGDQSVILTGGNRHTNFASNYPLDILRGQLAASEGAERPAVCPPTHILNRLRLLFQCIPYLLHGRSYLTTKNTTIGNDVWVGFGSTIMGGVTVGDGAVVAARSVVFSDVPPYAVVAGNPARVIRSRFSPRIVERLLRIRWWDWPEDEIRQHLDWFYRPITEFVERFDAETRRS